MNQKMKYLISAAMLGSVGFLNGGVSSVYAEGPVYELNPVTVTAQREKAPDLETPATVDILTADDIQKTGATSVHEALKFSTGIIMHAQGPRNISQGTMTNKAVIRGNEKGTLVLMDGVPINQGGRYNLEDIPVDAVEKIEVVRGGGAVLYGSEASGGVVNIITKGTRPNMVKVGVGNYGIQNYTASAQAGKFGITYSYDHTGRIDNISDPTIPSGKQRGSAPDGGLYYNIVRGEHSSVNWRYNFNDDLYFTHTYGENSDHYTYKYDGHAYKPNTGADYKDVIHSTKENLAQLHFDHGDLKANIFYNRRDQKTENWIADQKVIKKKGKFTYPNAPKFNPNTRNYDHTKYEDQSMGFDISNRWHFNKGSFMVGYNFQRNLETRTSSDVIVDGYVTKDGARNSYQRNMHSIYGQLAYDITAKDKADFNFRETWTESDSAGNKYSKFTPEINWMHFVNYDTTVYAKAGKSFMMPTFSQLYGGGNIVGVPGLKPENGKHYELGLKKNIGQSTWRVDVFHYNIKDHLDADTSKFPEVSYKNTDIRNTGIELDWSRKQNENLSYHLGISYSHPEKRKDNENNGQWHDYYGRVQFNGGIDYTAGKLTTALEWNVLGARTRDSAPYSHFKDQCFTDLNFSYQANTNSRFFLNIDNLFNRHDIVSSSSSSFYNLGRNFMMGYEYKF